MTGYKYKLRHEHLKGLIWIVFGTIYTKYDSWHIKNWIFQKNNRKF